MGLSAMTTPAETKAVPAESAAAPPPTVTEEAAPRSAEPSLARTPESAVAAARTMPDVQSTPPVPAAPTPKTGKVRFSVKPWGEVFVDGKSRGVSPPLKELTIPEGRHRIQIKNGDFPGYDGEVDIKPGSRDEIAYSFKAP